MLGLLRTMPSRSCPRTGLDAGAVTYRAELLAWSDDEQAFDLIEGPPYFFRERLIRGHGHAAVKGNLNREGEGGVAHCLVDQLGDQALGRLSVRRGRFGSHDGGWLPEELPCCAQRPSLGCGRPATVPAERV